jgi:squalene-hopene/tetraprenyl-beta-curcumene cyclase
MKTLVALLMTLAVAVAHAAETTPLPAKPKLPSLTDESLLKEVARAQERGMEFIRGKQLPDGSWNKHPAITGLAITAILRSSKTLTDEQKEAVDKGVKFILTCVKPTGAIFGGGESDKYPNYSTAICTMALLATGNPEYLPIIRKARAFLIGSQFDEDEDVDKSDPSYGGIGYGRRERPDMSNMAWAVEAIRLTESLETEANDNGDATSKLHWQKAVAFLTASQNLPDTNPQPWSKNAREEDKGGFIYMPGSPDKGIMPVSFAEEEPSKDNKTPLRSYGSMTYAGLKSMIYAELKKDDPRVQAAVMWLQRNYTLEENPGMGAQGLYYYYHTVAKSLTALGEDTFKDAAGKERDWRHELMKKYVTLQKADGFWQNENNRWWENDPVLCTSYSLIALGILKDRRYP